MYINHSWDDKQLAEFENKYKVGDLYAGGTIKDIVIVKERDTHPETGEVTHFVSIEITK
jgi:hypothetical protein